MDMENDDTEADRVYIFRQGADLSIEQMFIVGRFLRKAEELRAQGTAPKCIHCEKELGFVKRPIPPELIALGYKDEHDDLYICDCPAVLAMANDEEAYLAGLCHDCADKPNDEIVAKLCEEKPTTH